MQPIPNLFLAEIIASNGGSVLRPQSQESLTASIGVVGSSDGYGSGNNRQDILG